MNIEFLEFQVHGQQGEGLVSIEENKNIPFKIKRVYYIFDTKQEIKRGFHAHKKLTQVLICVKGSCNIRLDDGKEKKDVILSSPSKGLLIKSCIWREMYNFSPDCVLMVLADRIYNEDDYIRSYEDFIKMVSR